MVGGNATTWDGTGRKSYFILIIKLVQSYRNEQNNYAIIVEPQF